MPIEPQHRKNLKRLANYLDRLPDDYEHFDMALYATDDLGRDIEVQRLDEHTAAIGSCGSVACALGHAPQALRRRPLWFSSSRWSDPGINWSGMSLQWFGVADGLNRWSFLFSAHWDRHDNTAKGAAARIFHYLALDGKLPAYWNYSDYPEGWHLETADDA